MFIVRMYHLLKVAWASAWIFGSSASFFTQYSPWRIWNFSSLKIPSIARTQGVGAAADVFELVAGAPIHAEVEEDEIGPRLDRIVEDVHPLIARDARGPDIRVRLDAHREDLVVPADVALDVEAEVGEQAVHDCGLAQLVLHDLGDDVLLLDRRPLGDPGHVAVAPRQPPVGLQAEEVDEVLAL